jgi:hypothetical protein
MNIIASALHNTDFADFVISFRPTMRQFFEFAQAGDVPGFPEDVQDRLRMRTGMPVVQQDPLTTGARFVVLPAQQWESPPPEDSTAEKAIHEAWAHVRHHDRHLIIVPDDGDMAYNISLFLPERRPDDVTALTSVRFSPASQTVCKSTKPCLEGLRVVGGRTRPHCLKNGCTRRCRRSNRIESNAETFKCYCDD